VNGALDSVIFTKNKINLSVGDAVVLTKIFVRTKGGSPGMGRELEKRDLPLYPIT
jgi:hypothetical protein